MNFHEGMDAREDDFLEGGHVRRDRIAAIIGEDTGVDVVVDDAGRVDGASYPLALAAFRAVLDEGWGRQYDEVQEEEDLRIAEFHGQRLRNASSVEQEAYRRMLQEHDEVVVRDQFQARNAARVGRGEREVRRHGLSLASREPTEREVRRHNRAVARREPRHRHRRERGSARGGRRGQGMRGDGGWGRHPVRMNANGFMPAFPGDDGSADGWGRRSPVVELSEEERRARDRDVLYRMWRIGNRPIPFYRSNSGRESGEDGQHGSEEDRTNET